MPDPKPPALTCDAPSNGKYVRHKACGGAQWNDVCAWTADELKVTCQISADTAYGRQISMVDQQVENGNFAPPATPPNPALPAATTTVMFKYTTGKTLNCDTMETVTLTVRASQTAGTAGDKAPGTASASKVIQFELHCDKCAQQKSKTDGNGSSFVPQNQHDQHVTVEFATINLDVVPRRVNLTVANALGWSISPPIPAFVNLAPGEDRAFRIDVTVPAGTLPGVFNDLALISELDGVAGDPPSAAVARIMVIPGIPVLSGYSLVLLAVLLAGAAIWYLRKQQVMARGRIA
jgi:hypothetical protein